MRFYIWIRNCTVCICVALACFGLNKLIVTKTYVEQGPNHMVISSSNYEPKEMMRVETKVIEATSNVRSNSGLAATSVSQERIPTYAPLCTPEQRINSIKHICEEMKLTQTTKQRNPHLMVQPEAKVGYCEISKVGSTNMKRVFATSTKRGRTLPKDFSTNWHKSTFQRKMGMKGDTGINGTIANLTKFFIVRHPFDRLISAYNSKLGPHSPGNGGYEALSRRIIKISNPLLNKTEIQRRNRATFPEFVHALTKRSIGLSNNHWIPFAQYCNPCQVDYKYIIRIESMTYDAAPIMELLNVSATHVDQTSYSTNKRLRYKDPAVIKNDQAYAVLKRSDPFKDIPLNEIAILKKLYALDLKLYGYGFDDETLMPSCEFSDSKCC